MRSLILPDTHNRTEIADEIIRKENPDEAIYLRDYPDGWGDDSPERNAKTFRYVKARLYLPGYIFLLGNHCAQYRWPNNSWLRTNCFTQEKCDAINEVFSKEDWQQLKWAVNRGNWWMSHAGLHPYFFTHAIKGFDPARTMEILERAEANCQGHIWDPVSDDKKPDNPGGPLWLRWNEFEPIPGINQIVGHTRQDEPAEITTPESRNINIDTQSQYYAILENNEVTIKHV